MQPLATAALPCPAPVAVAVWQRAVQAHDIDDYATAQSGWDLRYEQLSPGRFSGQFQHIQLPGLRLVEEQASQQLRQIGRLDPDTYGFALAASLPGEAFFHGQRLQDDSLMMGRGDALDMSTPAHYHHLGVVVDTALLRSLWERLYQKPWSDWLDQRVVIAARPGMAEHLRQLQRQTLERLAQTPDLATLPEAAVLRLRDGVLIEWVEAIPAQVELGDVSTQQARQHLVRRAREHMLQHCTEPPSLLALCSAIGTSPRKLDYCFRDVLGTSPARYLRALRLDGARRTLKQGNQSVQDVAAHWGFWHLGAFAADYKRQFGELPSVTARRSALSPPHGC